MLPVIAVRQPSRQSKGNTSDRHQRRNGHDSEATLQIYLASLDTSVVDKANSLILKIFNSSPFLNTRDWGIIIGHSSKSLNKR